LTLVIGPQRESKASVKNNMTADEIVGSTMEQHRILVVDDETSIRTLLTALLTDAGYEVHTAANAADAMALFASECFDVLLSDVRMPGMNGHELVRNVVVQHPNVRCCLMSGLDLERDNFRRTPRQCPLLPKPFRAQQALALIAQILGDALVS
jgi:DNA-binding NtrC family response regulator